jgi:HEAT repeat protein
MRIISKLFIVIVGILAIIGFATCAVVTYRFTLKKIKQLQDNSYIEIIKKGEELRKYRKLKEAEKCFRDAIKWRSDSRIALCSLAEILLAQSNNGKDALKVEEAVSYYIRYIRVEDWEYYGYYIPLREKNWRIIGDLGNTGSGKAILPLSLWLEYENEIQLHAASALGKITDKAGAIQELIQILTMNEDLEMRRSAALGLKNLAAFRLPAIQSNGGEEIPPANEFIRSLKRMAGSVDSMVEPLSRVLQQDEYVKVRLHVVHAIEATSSPDAIKPLLFAALNKDEEEDVRIAAIQALGRLGNQEAIEPLERLENDDSEDSTLRFEASKAILQILISDEHDAQMIGE